MPSHKVRSLTPFITRSLERRYEVLMTVSPGVPYSMGS